ncbi:MAG: YjbQ family protein, partial [Saprospiraceae bacterium]|nr:YjbQ family protein [Saprospiraceae bacterium]
MVKHIEIQLKPTSRGFLLITDDITQRLGELPETGILHVFIHHTSAGLCLNENADPTVLGDFERIFNHLVPENLPFLRHTIEGPDD